MKKTHLGIIALALASASISAVAAVDHSYASSNIPMAAAIAPTAPAEITLRLGYTEPAAIAASKKDIAKVEDFKDHRPGAYLLTARDMDKRPIHCESLDGKAGGDYLLTALDGGKDAGVMLKALTAAKKIDKVGDGALAKKIDGRDFKILGAMIEKTPATPPLAAMPPTTYKNVGLAAMIGAEMAAATKAAPIV